MTDKHDECVLLKTELQYQWTCW